MDFATYFPIWDKLTPEQRSRITSVTEFMKVTSGTVLHDGGNMADSVTGGGLHGKDLSKADVSVNIYAFLKAQQTGEVVSLSCAIGDDTVDGIPYADIVKLAKDYIDSVGGFEKFAEWGLY